MAEPQKLFATVEKANLMTPRQREVVQRDIRTLERALNGQPMPYYGGDVVASQYEPTSGGPASGQVLVLRDQPLPDRELLQRNLNASRETLQAGTAPELSAAAKNTLYARYKTEWQAYQEGMPSHEQMWRATWQNVQLYIRHQAANKRRGKFLQNVHRILEPADDVFHLEALRPEKPTPFNGAAFRAGYDHVQWSDSKELELQMQELDDATYYAFLQLKARGITTAKLFQDQLHITPQMYEACLARLRAATDALATEGPALDPPSELLAEVPQSGPSSGLSDAEDAALQQYGDAVLAALTDGITLDENTATKVVVTHTPDLFAGKQGTLGARNKARAALRGLVKMGFLVEDGTQFRINERQEVPAATE
jgi:hypothetical protein